MSHSLTRFWSEFPNKGSQLGWMLSLWGVSGLRGHSCRRADGLCHMLHLLHRMVLGKRSCRHGDQPGRRGSGRTMGCCRVLQHVCANLYWHMSGAVAVTGRQYTQQIAAQGFCLKHIAAYDWPGVAGVAGVGKLGSQQLNLTGGGASKAAAPLRLLPKSGGS